jgi:hypothetical protein
MYMDVITKEQWEAAAATVADENYSLEDQEERKEFVNSIYANFKQSEIASSRVELMANLGKALGVDMSSKIFGLGVDFGMRLEKLRGGVVRIQFIRSRLKLVLTRVTT